MKTDINTVIEQIFLSGVQSVLPDKLIRSNVVLTDNVLHIADIQFSLVDFENIYLIAVGKAGAIMAKEMELILGDLITDGLVLVKYEHGCKLQRTKLIEAGHPLPDQNGVQATDQILAMAHRAKKSDLVFCLISGGASALMADFPPESTLEDLVLANELLVKCGADIKEINAVRKHLSGVKGGQLAAAIYPATTVSLILSDVVGNPIDVIASGPTCADSSSFTDALAVVEKHKLLQRFPVNMLERLKSGVSGLIPETPKSDNMLFSNVHNIIVGNNKIALMAARDKAAEYGLPTYILNDSLEGDFIQVANYIFRAIHLAIRRHSRFKPVCLLFGGEPTVKVTGSGLGGRNQHLALYCATLLKNEQGITILCAGTDGTDGPTNVAGATVDCNTYEKAFSNGFDAQEYLRNADSYHFFKKNKGHVITGSTTTNVMDMIIVIIE